VRVLNYVTPQKERPVRVLNYVTCNRCTCTASCMWVDPKDVVAAHVCPDGERSDAFIVTTRIIPGPGEHGKESALIASFEGEAEHGSVEAEHGSVETRHDVAGRATTTACRTVRTASSPPITAIESTGDVL
jgi:hypothetical protein